MTSFTIMPAREGVVIGERELIVEGTVRPDEDTDAVPTGRVHLEIGGVQQDNAPSATIDDEGHFALPPFSLPVIPRRAGPIPFTVSYEGDGVFLPSVSPVTHLRIYQSDIAIDLRSSRKRSALGKKVTFTARVAYRERNEPAPSGAIAFAVDGVSSSGIKSLDEDGVARWTASLEMGSHVVSADYIPAAGDLATSSAQLIQRIARPSGKVKAGLTVLPSPLRGKSVGFEFSGELVPPDGFPEREACSGTVSIRMREGEDRVAETDRLNARCRYSLSMSFPKNAKIDPIARISTTTTFRGNDAVRSEEFSAEIAQPASNHTPPAKWLVSVGDSYIAGEGGRWAGNTNHWFPWQTNALGADAYDDNQTNGLVNPPGHPVVGTSELIWRCHRSRVAEAFSGALPALNLACSGATVGSYTATDGSFKPGVDFYVSGSNMGQARMLSTFASTHKVKLVVLGIGGNDYGFGDILFTCVKDYLTSFNWAGFHSHLEWRYSGPYTNWRKWTDWANWGWVSVQGAAFDKRKYCSEDSSVTNRFSPANVANITARVKTAILNVARALAEQGYQRSDYTILVQTAPDPVAGSGDIRYSQGAAFHPLQPSTWVDKPRQDIGGCGFWDKDLDWIHNVALPTFNSTFKQAAADAANSNVAWWPTYKPRVAWLDVKDAFAGRRLCQNGVSLLPASFGNSWTDSGAVDGSEWVTQIRTASTLVGPYQLQEGFHPNYWGHLALRACVRAAYTPVVTSSTPKNGTCTIAGTGLNMSATPPRPKMKWTHVP